MENVSRYMAAALKDKAKGKKASTEEEENAQRKRISVLGGLAKMVENCPSAHSGDVSNSPWRCEGAHGNDIWRPEAIRRRAELHFAL